MSAKLNPVFSLFVGAAIGLGGAWLLGLPGTTEQNTDSAAPAKKERKPLYWVAPMDPSYKRDKPGKSPMGMDLIPVYEEDLAGGSDAGPGTVRINPDVVNNLGVRTAQASRGIFKQHLATVGYVQFNEDLLSHVHSRVTGWVEKLYVKAQGDPVEAGQPLYTLYSPELVNAQEELLLAMSRGNPGLIRSAEERLKALQVPPQLIKQVKQSRQVQQTVTFYAPQGGVIAKLNIREGFYVTPKMTMMAIGDLSTIWVVGEIFEQQAGMVKEGDPVDMTLDYLPGQQWQGKIAYIYPTVDQKTRTMQVRMVFDNPALQLKPGMFASLNIHSQAAEPTLLIPREALIRTGQQDRVVLALGDGAFKSVAVKVGRIGRDEVEILDGLMEGDHVVTSAQFLLDSESSKTSDFKRLHHGDEDTGDNLPVSVWVESRIEGIMVEHKMLTIHHQAVEAWGMPEMTMDIDVDPAVDLSALSVGMTAHLELTDDDKGFRVTAVHIPDNTSQTDHSQHQE